MARVNYFENLQLSRVSDYAKSLHSLEHSAFGARRAAGGRAVLSRLTFPLQLHLIPVENALTPATHQTFLLVEYRTRHTRLENHSAHPTTRWGSPAAPMISTWQAWMQRTLRIKSQVRLEVAPKGGVAREGEEQTVVECEPNWFHPSHPSCSVHDPIFNTMPTCVPIQSSREQWQQAPSPQRWRRRQRAPSRRPQVVPVSRLQMASSGPSLRRSRPGWTHWMREKWHHCGACRWEASLSGECCGCKRGGSSGWADEQPERWQWGCTINHNLLQPHTPSSPTTEPGQVYGQWLHCSAGRVRDWVIVLQVVAEAARARVGARVSQQQIVQEQEQQTTAIA